MVRVSCLWWWIPFRLYAICKKQVTSCKVFDNVSAVMDILVCWKTWVFMPPPMYDLKSEWMFGVSRLGHSVGSRFSDWGETACTSWDVVPISFSCFGGLSRFWAVDWQCYIQGLLFFPFVGQLLVNLAGFCPKHNPFADYHMIKLILCQVLVEITPVVLEMISTSISYL